MAGSEFEARLAVLEREVARLNARLEGAPKSDVPWWERVAGSFAGDRLHDRAMKLGRAYRASLRPGKARARKA